MKAHRRTLVAAGVLLLLLVGAWWFAREPRGDARPAGVESAPLGEAVPARGLTTAGSAASVLAAGAADAASAAGAAGAEPAVALAEDRARAALKERMKADWCGFRAHEQERQSEAVLEQVRAGSAVIGRDEIANLNSTPGAEVVEEAMAQVRQRWVRALLQRGDPRSVAAAEYLRGPEGGQAQARARLQALARTSSDPMVTALALQRPCESGVCRNIERAQWSRLEPANLQAWLTLLGDARARHTQEAYALERMASEARYSRSYEREFKALLLELPQTESPGLAQDAELQLIIGTTASWPIPSMRTVMELCSARAAGPATQRRCEAVAELFWQGENLIERGMALGLVRRLALTRAGVLLSWESRAREFEAARGWGEVAAERAASAASQPARACDWQAGWRRDLQAAAALGEWGHIRVDMQAQGADDAALSAQWRRAAGRSVLDPLPPASVAAR